MKNQLVMYMIKYNKNLIKMIIKLIEIFMMNFLITFKLA